MNTAATLSSLEPQHRVEAATSDREQDLQSHHRNCPACGTDNRRQAALEFSRGDWLLKACSSCELVYLENAPLYAELEEQFAWEKSYVAEREARRQREP